MSDEKQTEANAKPAPVNGKFLGCGGCVWAAAGGLLLLIVAALFLPAVTSRSDTARRHRCMNNFKHISVALMLYENQYGGFPPAYTVDEQGRLMHSWRALILPFLGDPREKLSYNYDQPWNSPANIAFAEKSPLFDYFHCPSDLSDSETRRETSYVMPVGPGAFGDGSTSRTFPDISDGTSNTIILTEMSHSGIFWTEPRDLKTSEMSYKLNDPHQIGMRSEHSGGVQAAFCDGHSEFISEDEDENTLKAMITINGSENMDELGN